MNVSIDIGEAKTLLVPPLILQPIVENAVKHGLQPKPGRGKINISSSIKESEVIITIKDNGIGIPEDELSTILNEHSVSLGLKNVHQRLKNFYGERYGLLINSDEGSGTTVTVKLPSKIQLQTNQDPTKGNALATHTDSQRGKLDGTPYAYRRG